MSLVEGEGIIVIDMLGAVLRFEDSIVVVSELLIHAQPCHRHLRSRLRLPEWRSKLTSKPVPYK